MKAEQPCPKCGGALYRSHTRLFLERAWKAFTAQRPFRCESCGWRAWLSLIDPGAFEPVDPLEPPDLASLDSAMKPPREPKRDFSNDDLL
jgi:predicted RNA-binding Zn-ribbon protein involved in translation (DUF1610 family)